MAQNVFNMPLRDAGFPLLSDLQSRTVINPDRGEQPDPVSITYCHDVMPTKEGYHSVKVVTSINSPVLLHNDFSDVRVIFGDKRARIYFAWDEGGRLYSLLPGSSLWITLPDPAPPLAGPGFDGNNVSIGTVNGVSYIWYYKYKGYTYDEATDTLVNFTPLGISEGGIVAMVSSFGYLVAFTEGDVAWSSTIDPVDFIPSKVTGAGGGSVADIAGDIKFVTTTPTGMLIYTTANVVSADYTGNKQFPWKFKEVYDSKGGIDLDLLAYEANSLEQFVYTTAGLQIITNKVAKVILPEVTDFLAGQVFEDFNTTTMEYEITKIASTATLKKKIKYIASRYLVISYGVSSFTHALIYDTALQRLGKVKEDHVDIIELILDDVFPKQPELAKQTIGFVRANGQIAYVEFSGLELGNGVLILGKLQHSRRRFVTIEGVDIDNVEVASLGPPLPGMDVWLQSTLDGKNFTTVQGVVQSTIDDPVRKYAFHETGYNHSVVILGNFNLVTTQVTYVIAGRR